MNSLNQNIDIVICTEAHADVLAGMHEHCFDQSWPTPSFIELLSMPGSFAFIACVDDEPMGFIFARQIEDEGEIITLGVLPNHRRQGLARTLVRLAESHLKKADGQTMFLEVAENNQAARKLYEQLGYQEVGRRERYYKTEDGTVDALILKTKLDATNESDA